MSPMLLALDTSTPRAALALGRPGGPPRTAATDPAARHGRALLPAVRDLLREAGRSPADLDALAVGLGPGSFTGLRIGLTAAKTLAYALNIPLVGLDSLEVLARNAPPEALRVAVAADAQRGEVFAADFARPFPGSPLNRLGPDRLEPADSWAAGLPPETLVLGPALVRLGADLPAAVRVAEAGLWFPEGAALHALAVDAYQAGRRDEPFFLEPVYLRRSAAEEAHG